MKNKFNDYILLIEIYIMLWTKKKFYLPTQKKSIYLHYIIKKEADEETKGQTV